MIDRMTIVAQIEDLERQRRGREDDIKAIDGALQLARHWLAETDKKLEAIAAEIAKGAAGEAEPQP